MWSITCSRVWCCDKTLQSLGPLLAAQLFPSLLSLALPSDTLVFFVSYFLGTPVIVFQTIWVDAPFASHGFLWERSFHTASQVMLHTKNMTVTTENTIQAEVLRSRLQQDPPYLLQNENMKLC